VLTILMKSGFELFSVVGMEFLPKYLIVC
jgi:hypothetical protein